MSETSTNKTNVTITSTNKGHKFTIGRKAPVINKETISEEQLTELAALLDNIIQDALIICDEECCEDQVTKLDVNSISRTIVKTLTEDMLLPKFDVLEYQKQINELRKQLAEKNNPKKAQTYIKDYNHENSRHSYGFGKEKK